MAISRATSVLPPRITRTRPRQIVGIRTFSHSLVKGVLARRPCPYTFDELDRLARHCTLQEDEANKVERQVRKAAAALVVLSRVGERFDAIVTGASAKGTFVRVLVPPIEGKLVRGEKGLDVGDRVPVQLTHVDVEQGYIDFAR